MYYHYDEHLLLPGKENYYKNVITGLNWLYKFTIENDWIFTTKDIENNIGLDYNTFLHFDTHILLSTLVSIILKNSNFLETWFI